MNIWLRIGHRWLLPRHCLLCLGAAEAVDLCAGCQSAMRRILRPCEGCGVPLESGRRCARCLDHRAPFARAHIPYLYAPPLSTLIHLLKYRQRLSAAAALGALLGEHLEACDAVAPQCIVPVPLHPSRQRRRGFNQSLEIARPVSARLGVPIAATLAKRRRAGEAQTRLNSAAERRKNVRRAFTVNAKRASRLQHVAILDDVVTTGATAGELAKTLRRAGVSRVDLWSLARAPEI